MLHTRVEKGETPVVFLSGEIDLDSAETFRWVITDTVRGVSEAIVDFADVTFIDSSGTGLIVRTCLDLQAQGTRLGLRNLSATVEEVFTMLKVRTLIGDAAFIDG